MQQGNLNRLGPAALAASLLLFSTLTPAAAEDETPRSLFGEVIDVRVVNLEVAVTSRGERLTDLGPEDFLLTVDGEEVPIDYFTEVQGGVAVARGDETRHAMVPALAPGEPVGTSYLLFIDERFSIKPHRDLVLRRMIEQLDALGPEDRMAVVASSGSRLEMLSSWSSSAPELARVLETALERPSFGAHLRVEGRAFSAVSVDRGDAVPASPRRETVDESASMFSTFRDGDWQLGAASSTGLSLTEESEVAWLEKRVMGIVTAATTALRTFANPPGRKVMLLMSGGWPDSPVDLLYAGTKRVDIGHANDRNRLYGSLIETANRLSYTLYPIDVPGVNDQRSNITRATLRRLARQTGGRPLLAGDRLKAFDKTVADTRSYYWIGFIPQWQGDDRSHKVKVEVRRRGADARWRRNYSDLSREREVTMMVESALRLGDEPMATPFAVTLGKVAKAGRGKVMVPLEALVPVDALTFLPHQDHYAAEVELRIAAKDSRGVAADIPVVPLTITLDEAPEEGETWRWGTRIKIRRERHEVLVSFFDKASGKLFTSRVEVDPRL